MDFGHTEESERLVAVAVRCVAECECVRNTTNFKIPKTQIRVLRSN